MTHSVDLFEPYIPNSDDNKVWVAWKTHVELVRMSRQQEFSSEDIKEIDRLVVESNKRRFELSLNSKVHCLELKPTLISCLPLPPQFHADPLKVPLEHP